MRVPHLRMDAQGTVGSELTSTELGNLKWVFFLTAMTSWEAEAPALGVARTCMPSQNSSK
jgi:hypothetical protein